MTTKNTNLELSRLFLYDKSIMMTSHDLRKQFIDFFVAKDHHQIDSAPLVPENDPTVLFTTAGMHPLVPYLLGEKHPEGCRLVNVQKCLRTDDIDVVGDISHGTFFEMMGYWSMGDYWKKESIRYTYDFYTKVLGFDPKKIAVTVFAGDDDAPFDKESYDVWKNEIKIPENRIFKYNKTQNWWGPAGTTGPCGPCSEMFIDTGAKSCGKNCGPACSCGKYIEIGNNVFMEYNKQLATHNSQLATEDFEFIKLKQRNVDVGLGFERLLMFVEKKNSIYETELFSPIISNIKSLSSKFDEKNARIVADHIRASVFLIADGVRPSNVDQGYILRRLLRRIIRYANLMGFTDDAYLDILASIVIDNYKDTYPEIDKKKDISKILLDEQNKFEKALEQGEKELSKIINVLKSHNQDKISGRVAFKLFESYGFPYELTQEIANEENLQLDKKEFDEAFQKHQLLSRKGAEAKFKGGLADNSEVVTRYHTATHLLHQALRQVLGDHVAQRGSNITADRMRFDFTQKDKMTGDQIKKVEDLVNEQIRAKLPVTMHEMDLREAQTSGAIGLFSSKYGKIVKVYTIGKNDRDYFSREICGGPHAKNTSELGQFGITKEESSSAGIRRIKAVLK